MIRQFSRGGVGIVGVLSNQIVQIVRLNKRFIFSSSAASKFDSIFEFIVSLASQFVKRSESAKGVLNRRMELFWGVLLAGSVVVAACAAYTYHTTFPQQNDFLFDVLWRYVIHVYGRARGFAHKHILSRSFNATLIVPGLYLGDAFDAHNVTALREHGITHIVTAVIGMQPAYPDNFTYLHVPVMDNHMEDLTPFFGVANDFLTSALLQSAAPLLDSAPLTAKVETKVPPSGSVLVHCMKGRSRSASLVLSYLMHSRCWSLQQAFEHVKHLRPIISPNSKFWQQLRQFEAELECQRTDPQALA